MPRHTPVILPYVPHVRLIPGAADLEGLLALLNAGAAHGYLAVAAKRRELWSYNSTRVPRRRYGLGLSEVRVRYFSAVPAFNLLALAGHKTVYTLGVDGGKHYAKEFPLKDCLANGHQSFDIQFREIARTCRLYDVRHVDLAREVRT